MAVFEKTLPEGYKEVYRIDATKTTFGIIMNLIALVVIAAFVLLAFLTVRYEDSDLSLLSIALLIVVPLVYMVLHELVHGAVYKAMTGEKLSFGLKWSCAYCGVPNVYVYRKTAIYALIAPLIVFSIVFIGLSVAFWFFDPFLYIGSTIMLGIHLGGCSGDIFVTILFLTKFKDKRTLMRDTGPEQTFYSFIDAPGKEEINN